MERIDLTSKQSKMLSYVVKHSKLRKNTKVIKLQWIASIWCQNGQKSQNYKMNQITINLHRFDVKTVKNVELRRKTFKTTQNYKTDQITMNLHRFDVKTITTTQNYESDQIIMHCINLTSKRSKMLSYVAKLQKWSNYNALHRFDIKTIKNVELRRKTFKTTQNYKSNQITMNCIDLTSKRSKMLRYVAKLQKWSNYNELHRFDVKTFKTFELGRKTTKVIKLQWSASIWHQNNQKCRVTS